ncbi:hypothetical protein ZYGR_0AY00990 [Zygosaccharomyces rouxii]|uniref:Uncharacterized protein n=1 Tax=Zygosaccharomyces rouxii TaxID=4956 RepID=A0A1Q3AIZ8_ZYGRO|nr:hypothetical protein ZYGR_0AY00990 [Zygosaccharomyces rouxii]
MRFVSCLPVSDADATQEEVDEVVLCESHFTQDDFPSSADALEDLTIEWLVLSEGSEIHQRHNCHLRNLQVFTDASETKYIWYELLRELTTHKVYHRDMEQKVRYTRWVCNAPEGGQWSICMELESGGIVRKVAQLELTPASHCELNLFRMTNELFRECCTCNDRMVQMKYKMDNVEHQINDLQEERKLLDQLLEKRDAQTRSIVVGLLNEKKRKITELQRQLKEQGPQDAELINRYVTDPVRGHSSLGRRRRRLANNSNNGGNDAKRKSRLPPQPLPKKLHIEKEDLESEAEQEEKQEFKFWGIKKLDSLVKREEEDLPNSSTSSTNESTGHTESSTDEDEKEKEGEEEEEETDVEQW